MKRHGNTSEFSSYGTRESGQRLSSAGRPALALVAGLSLLLAGCGEQQGKGKVVAAPGAQVGTASITAKSSKRGIAYDLANDADMAALAPGVSWWYNWSPSANSGVPSDYNSRYAMDFYPMVWNGSFNLTDVENRIRANPQAKYLLVLNEPNLTDQANMTPNQAASLWPQYEKIAADTGVKIVGPAITWGTMAGYQDPVVWLDSFYSAYRSQNGGRDPRIDYLAFHWYDYGIGAQLDRLTKYGKPFWVTEFANWHSGTDGAQIDTLDKQKAQMADMVSTLENRADVFRYAWFTGRISSDVHYDSLLGATGQLTSLGQYYLSLPYAAPTTTTPTPPPPTTGSCGTTNLAQGKPASASSVENAGTPASAAFDGNTGTRWSSAFADPQWVQVNLGSVQNICSVTLQWEAAYAKAFQIQTSNDGANWTTIYSTTTGTGGTQTIPVSGSGQYVRMYGTQRATGYGYSLYEFQVFGGGATTSSCGTANAALNKPASASSTENSGTPASAAFDGNTGTRWSSAFADPQWVQVNLGSVQQICGVTLQWEGAYGKAFQIQTSNDGANWTTIYSTTTGTGGTQTLNVSGSGQYVRMYGTARGTGYGYSLYEFQVRTSP